MKKQVILIVVSLLVVALLGTIMRYKILFELPFFHQKNLQHAHSHFAFVGWISQCIYFLMLGILFPTNDSKSIKYYRLMYLNLALSYLMLFSFMYAGYWWLSILTSSLCTLISIVYSIWYYRDLNTHERNSHALANAKPWILAAGIFNILSTFGTIALSYFRINGIIDQESQLSAIYFYLHFQYNGFFAFAMIAIFAYQFASVVNKDTLSKYFFVAMVASTLGNYGLSVLWMKMNPSLYTLIVLSSLIYLWAWIHFSQRLREIKIADKGSIIFYRLLWITVSIKVVLQTASVIPYMSQLAYSLRSVVIAYLHLALLVITSSYFLYQLLHTTVRKIPFSFFAIFGLILINELVLGVQGMAGVWGIYLPSIPYFLLGISVLICLAIMVLIKNLQNRTL